MSDMIELKNNISIEEFRRLRESVGFQKLTAGQAEAVLSRTSFVVNAVYEGKSVGVVRIFKADAWEEN